MESAVKKVKMEKPAPEIFDDPVAHQLVKDFSAWQSQSEEHTSIFLIRVTDKSMTFQWAEDNTQFELGYPRELDQIWFAHSGSGNPWASQINEYILEKQKVTLSSILKQLIAMASEEEEEGEEEIRESLEMSQDELQKSGPLRDSAEMDVFAGKFAEYEPEFAELLQGQVDKMNDKFDFRVAFFSPDNGIVTIVIPVEDLLSEPMSQLLDVKRTVPLVVSLDYRRKAFDEPKTFKRQPNFSLQQGDNKSQGLKKSLIREVVRSYVEENFAKETVLLNEEDFDEPVIELRNSRGEVALSNKGSNKEEITVATPANILSLTEMGFDPQTAQAALEVNKDSLEVALNKLLNQEFYINSDCRGLMEMGFSYNIVQKALKDNNDNTELALNQLLSSTGSSNSNNSNPKLLKREGSLTGQFSFIHGLYSTMRLRLKFLTQLCCICGKKHSCNFLSEKPVICSNALCMFRYEELGMGVKQDHIFLCPFTICPEKYDPKDKTINSLVGNDVTKQLTLENLLQLYETKYSIPKYLPHEEMLNFAKGVTVANVRIKSITSVLKPDHVFRYEAKVRELQKARGEKNVKFEMVYHGTAPNNISGIIEKGLLVPGNKTGVAHATDTGFWGKGIYLAPNAQTSIGYCRNGSRLLICSVVMGKVFQCTNMIQGQPKVSGYDSHKAPGGGEYIVFDSSQVLVCYVVEFDQNVHGGF